MTWLLVMLNKILALIGALLGMFGLNILNANRNKKAGANEERLENAEHELEEIEEANRIRDRLEHDPEYRERVRDRFTRR